MILVGDCVELMAAMEPASVDAVVCDPPYGLGFMGKEWDSRFEAADQRRMARDSRSFQSWCETWATEALRVLKPGGHLLAFGGTRTYHRLAGAIEDAGFEIRDTLCWLYGSGFPKSLNVSKAIDKGAGVEGEVLGVRSTYRPGSGTERDAENFQDRSDGLVRAPATDDARRWQGWGTALKPAHEPIVLARKPLAGTVAANVLAHGTGALNVDGCRIEGAPDPASWTAKRTAIDTSDGRLGQKAKNIEAMNAGLIAPPFGRWPANVVLDEEAAAMLDEQTGTMRDGVAVGGLHSASGKNVIYARMEKVEGAGDHGYGGSGGASRFYYVAKASRAERNAGLEGFEARRSVDDDWIAENRKDAPGGGQPSPQRNHHPTVKPIALMRWLVRLVTPPGGLVVDPFCGSGTTGIACALEGFAFTGCEQDADYARIAEARIAWWAEHGEDALRIVAERERGEAVRAELEAAGQLDLLGGAA